MSREDISALADGELAAGTLPSAMKALATGEGQAAWDLYHQIGDALRSAELAANVSRGFSARMAARMAAEPVLGKPRLDLGGSRVPLSYAETTGAARAAAPLLPVLCSAADAPSEPPLPRLSGRQLTLSVSALGAALVAVATAAFIATPHALDAGAPPAGLTLTHARAGAAAPPPERALFATQVAHPAQAEAAAGLAQDDVGPYLAAHQGLAPTLYQTARYVRLASLPVSGK